MKVTFKDGKIICKCLNYEEVNFDIGTNKFFTQFNGKGGFNYFHYVNNSRFNLSRPSIFNIYIDNELISPFIKKKVINIGRMQKIILFLSDGKIELSQFGKESFIFNKVSINLSNPHKIILSYDFTAFVDVPNLSSSSEVIYNKENYCYYITCKNKEKINVAISFTDQCQKIVKKTNIILKEVTKEIESIDIPDRCNSDIKKCLYYSCMFAALQNYKEIPNFSALSAGVNYLVPFRTYFRDSYWTMLPLYKDHLDIIKNQIMTLSKGIKEDGECPSAVKSDFTGFWGGHYDSPLFFTMMVYDYINNGGDESILLYKPNDTLTIKQLCIKVIERMFTFTDKTHLIVKKAPYNKLDWADAVNRDGYVTYDNCLYYRSLLALSKLTGLEKYKKEALFVKKSINDILWNDKKGYYVNFLNDLYCEDNLSIDTVFSVIFDIVPEERKEILLDKFEEILYSKNHTDLVDFGVMCVYPLYKNHDSTDSLSKEAFRFHNGANWPYLTAMLAYALAINNRNYDYALTSWYTFSIKRGNFTTMEFITPYAKEGSMLQAWSSAMAFVLQYCNKNFFLI